MGGGVGVCAPEFSNAGPDSPTFTNLDSWEGPWRSDGEGETDGDKPWVGSKGSALSSEREERIEEVMEELQTSLSCPTSPIFPKDNPQLELRRKILKQDEAPASREDVRLIRDKLARYTPGSSLFYVKGKQGMDRVIPDMTTLLIVGLKGAGKSTLVNNVIRVLHKKSTGFYKAHVSDDPTENGTCFLGEYVICGRSSRPTVSMFDTRGLPEDDTTEGLALLEGWMKDGVRHGQMDLRASDSEGTKESLETRGRHGDHRLSKKRRVDCVIFVINAVAVLEMKRKKKCAQIVQLYKCPYLTFKDDRPVVVMTHGDKLSSDDRITARICLGEILGVSPIEQIFDISGTTMNSVNKKHSQKETVRDIALLDMLTFALDCADRNLPYKEFSVASLKELFNSIAAEYRGLDRDRRVAFIGMVVFLYIFFILLITACASLSRILHKKNRFW